MYRSNSTTSRAKDLQRWRARRSWSIVIYSAVLTVLASLLLLLTVVPIISPSTGANLADMLRAAVGPAPVAILESASFFLQDKFNQVRYQVTGDQMQIAFSDATQGRTGTALAPSTSSPANDQNSPIPSSPPGVQPPPAEVFKVVLDAPPIGWQAYGPYVNGFPAMAHALEMLDAQRSYTGVALVRIDLSRLQLHMMPGIVEPAHPPGITKAIPDLGMVPTADQSHLVAAFNGGFKQEHGYYGMMTDGITLLPPINGMATVALYQDGTVKIGAWGRDIFQTSDLIAFRQNCPPILDLGQVNPALYQNDRNVWGTTANTDITWRTGLGITQDGHYLIYAVGNGTPAATLAEALKQAGAYMAMQLDINQYYAHFINYHTNNDPNSSATFHLTGDRLVAEMIDAPHFYLSPNPRDFFYLTDQ